MKVHELIEQLEDMNPEALVFIAYQPNYPLCARAGNIVEAEERDRVYIGESAGGNNDYLQEYISEQLF
jgi:hypothetical protein